MTVETVGSAAYTVAALLFILALAGLSRHETARAGNGFGIAGMAIALLTTLVIALTEGIDPLGIGLLIGAVLIGAVIGLIRAGRVPMTGMPELIALFHSFVGLAAVLVGWNGYLEVEAQGGAGFPADLLGIHHAEVVIGVFIGAVTFTGSIVAWGKLAAKFSSAPLVLPGKNVLNLGSLVVFAGLTVWFVVNPTLTALIAVTVVALALGVHLVALHRRRRHAGRGVHAQQLLGLGRRGLGLPARQRPADHHRRPGRLLRCLPVLHHVQGDEPLVHLGHRGRLRHRGLVRGREGLRGAPRDQRRTGSPRCSTAPPAWSSPPATAWPSPRPSTRSPSSPVACARRA